MKTLVSVIKKGVKASLVLILLISANSASSQVVSELQFSNPSLESGVAGENGAQYRFPLVASGIDAVVQIKGRSSSQVVLSNIDTSGPGLGYGKAFQPVLGIPGTAPANSNWSMDFNLTFYKTGTNTKISISQFYVTGLDIDGDDVTLSEWTQMNKVKKIDTAIINRLTFTKTASSGTGDDYKVEGVITNAPGIDTSATFVMATYRYENKDGIDFTIGAKTSGLTTTAGMRLNSLWFRDFFTPPLPVKMISFTANLNKNKADLKWITATEQNVSHYVIEKSLDGNNFRDAGIVFSNGNTTDETQYGYSDNISNDKATIIYYRLRSVDLDGKTELSATRMIRIAQENSNTMSILTYPNPVTNEIRVTIPANWQSKKVVYDIVTLNGQVARHVETASAGQTEAIAVSNLAPGFYAVRANCEGQVVQQRIIKQ